MHVSTVVKMAINHLNAQNRKKADHHLVEVVAVEAVVDHVVVVVILVNVVLVVVMITVIVQLEKQLVRRSNSMTTMTSG
jgi:hypothetical protein